MEFANEEEEEESTDKEEVRTDLSCITPPGSPGSHIIDIVVNNRVIHKVVHVGPVVSSLPLFACGQHSFHHHQPPSNRDEEDLTDRNGERDVVPEEDAAPVPVQVKECLPSYIVSHGQHATHCIPSSPLNQPSGCNDRGSRSEYHACSSSGGHKDPPSDTESFFSKWSLGGLC